MTSKNHHQGQDQADLTAQIRAGHALLGGATDPKAGREAALAHFAHLRQEYPDRVEVWLESAFLLDRLGREKAAIEFYEKALSFDTVTGTARRDCLVCLGSSLRNMGRAAEAVERLEQARAQFKDDLAVISFLALALHDAGRSTEAVKLLGLNLVKTASASEDLKPYSKPLQHKFRALKAGTDSNKS